ncbi:MAG: hypothetical protein KGJ80_17020, partial [Chloroflexota bacterium]|nr:hypothetical protein [Chloroflexota bacterium]
DFVTSARESGTNERFTRPMLKKGVTKQIDFAHDGADVTIWRKILVDGQVAKRDKFFSRYDPWVARYSVGMKVVK